MEKIMEYLNNEKNKALNQDQIITVIWLTILAAVMTGLSLSSTRAQFIYLTNTHPYLMGMLELALLGTMGDLLGTKIVKGRWKIFDIKIHQRILVWAFIGILFTIAFPMMVTNRFLNKLIDNDNLFSSWPVVNTFKKISWEHMLQRVAPTCLWFWLPVNTITFLLAPEFRVISGALLAVVLGFILGIVRKKEIN